MKKLKGFTLIEISIAIAFISILLITIALVTTDIVSSYRKGTAMKSVNSLGLDLISDFTSSISKAPSVTFANFCEYYAQEDARSACNADHAYLFTFQKSKAAIYINDTTSTEAPIFGAFCTGKDSYIWNTGYALNRDDYHLLDGNPIPSATLTYSSAGETSTISNFRLLKIDDPSRMVCMTHLVDLNNDDKTYSLTNSNEFDISENIFGSEYNLSAPPTELITSTGSLALYDLTVFPPTQDSTSKRLFYSASMILATISGGINILSTGDYCDPTSHNFLEFDYCAVNKFNFAMRATGE